MTNNIINNSRKVRQQQIGHATHKKRFLIVTRDQHGKFYVTVNGVMTQKKLVAEEIVRYLLNAMNEG